MKLVLLVVGAAMAAMAGESDGKAPVPSPSEESDLRALLTIRRVYIDQLTGGQTAAQMRDILLASLAGAKLFVVTENPERADATSRTCKRSTTFRSSSCSSTAYSALPGSSRSWPAQPSSESAGSRRHSEVATRRRVRGPHGAAGGDGS